MTGYFTFLHCLQKNVLLLPPFSFTGIETIIEKMSLFLLSRGEANDKIFCIFTALKKVVFPVSFSRHLFKIIVVSPLFSSSSCIRTRVSSASATTSTTAAPLLSTSLRRYSPSVSVQECFIIISTLSLMGVVDELKAGFRLPPLPPPPPPPAACPLLLAAAALVAAAVAAAAVWGNRGRRRGHCLAGCRRRPQSGGRCPRPPAGCHPPRLWCNHHRRPPLGGLCLRGTGGRVA